MRQKEIRRRRINYVFTLSKANVLRGLKEIRTFFLTLSPSLFIPDIIYHDLGYEECAHLRLLYALVVLTVLLGSIRLVIK